MKIYKGIFIILLVILIFMSILLFFKDELLTFIWVKEYEQKYKDINLVEKTLQFNETTNTLEENNINLNEFKISLSDLKYSKDEKKLNFNFKFESGSTLNQVGYILRVYNTEYCLGHRPHGYISLLNPIEYMITYNKFYEETFGYKSQPIEFSNMIVPDNDLVNECTMSNQSETLEDGGLLNKISFNLPKEFVINDNFKIELFDINYQNTENSTFHQVTNPLTKIRYTINLNEKY